MKRTVSVFFIFTVLMVIIMRYQGRSLLTPVSPRGIIDLEFAETTESLRQLRLFWNTADLRNNVYLDFLFIVVYTGFLFHSCRWIGTGESKKTPELFSGMALAAGFFDVCENFMMLMAWNGSDGDQLLQAIRYCAIIKFFLVGAIIIYGLVSLLLLLRRPNHLYN